MAPARARGAEKEFGAAGGEWPQGAQSAPTSTFDQAPARHTPMFAVKLTVLVGELTVTVGSW